MRRTLLFGLITSATLIGQAPILAAPLPANSSTCVEVPGGSSGDIAVVNITNTGATGRGYGAVRASDATPVYDRAAAQQYSSVNFAAGTPPNPNLAFSAVGSDIQVCYDGATAQHNVILDVAAVIPASVATASAPRRLLDTRGGARLPANSFRCVTVPGGSDGDVAVVNITNTAAAGGGFGALRASDATPVFSRPVAQQYSSVNFAPNTPPNPNLAFSTIGPDGAICYDGAAAAHHTILDLTAILPASTVRASDPQRILDTRSKPGSVTESQILNQTLPEGTCGWVGESIGLRLRNGVIDSPEPLGGSISVFSTADEPRTIIRLDFNGDGLDDAAYVVRCWGGGTNVDYELMVHLSGRSPVRFSERDLYTSSQMTDDGFVNGVEDLRRTNDSSVELTWFGTDGNDPNCCPSLEFKTQFVADPQPRISRAVQVAPGTERIIGIGDSRCVDRLLGADVDGEVVIRDQLCLSGWAYVAFCFDGECGLGDSQAVLRYENNRWGVYTNFPNFQLCEAEARADGMPFRIRNRINFAC